MEILPVRPLAILLLALLPAALPQGAAAKPKLPIKDFLKDVNARLIERWSEAERAAWVAANFITVDTQAIEAAASERLMAATSEAIQASAAYPIAKLDPESKRMLTLLRLSTPAPAPLDPAKRSELAKTLADLGAMYGAGKWCPEGQTGDACQDLGALSKIMGESRDPQALLEAWQRWRTVSPAMKPLYERFVALGNEGAKSLEFKDLGDMWRSGYDMPAPAFEAETERLWQQVRPLYEELHCYVRGRLAQKYPGVVEGKGTIPAHVLGNMWAQEWLEIYPLVEPFPGKAPLDVTGALKAKGWDALKMVKLAEGFFTGLGLKALPKTFFERSLFVKPRDRDVKCHASAWDVSYRGDVRIKMCIEPTESDLITIHHELGHIYYYLYYNQLPILYQSGAHDGFHEAIGDALALSVTPGYLKQAGILDSVPTDDEGLLNVQMKVALDKIAFLPFGRMIDQWRWDVFSGKVSPEQWNDHWWKLRGEYQGIHAPVARPKDAFDPGAKYHIPANTPYVRYFLSFVVQFQFYKALCEAAGHEGPLHTCSFAGSQAAGDRLAKVLAMGASKPWPDAMEAFTGQRQMDASALLEYFAPLRAWLQEQNKGQTCGW
ncbi:MAG: M2 family metallopeptidase [Myxococcales bacterium]|nr:M2 family metallopeptidase [Myxococcales bacterium]MCB9524079.1 M2 family metallopeptidase [Myxococcales bacterium]